MSKTILITGGAGYIGSHACLYGLENNYNIVALDSLEKNTINSIHKVEKLTNKSIKFYKGTSANPEILDQIFSENKIDIVMHFGGLKSVSEGEVKKLQYYSNNIAGTEMLIMAAKNAGVKEFIFSSSAAVYGNSDTLPITTKTALNPSNYYGQTKLEGEKVISEHIYNSEMGAVSFRYFNVVGNHKNGELGENPQLATNLLPILFKNILGQIEEVSIFGGSFNTKDGSQERDYIDVYDLIRAHYLAINKSQAGQNLILNLSTGKSTSCFEMIRLVNDTTNKEVKFRIVEARKNDPVLSYSTFDEANLVLNWSPEVSLKESIQNQWKWISQNPQGHNS